MMDKEMKFTNKIEAENGSVDYYFTASTNLLDEYGLDYPYGTRGAAIYMHDENNTNKTYMPGKDKWDCLDIKIKPIIDIKPEDLSSSYYKSVVATDIFVNRNEIREMLSLAGVDMDADYDMDDREI